MQVSSISNQQNFNGNVVILGKISTTQNALFNIHKAAVERMIASKPYDIFVKQSKSKKTITLSADKDCKTGYFVRKNKQNFEEAAGYVINDKDKKLAIEKLESEKIKQQKEKEMQATVQIWQEYLQSRYSFSKIFGI